LLLAALATPLVVSVHTVVSFDFTIGIEPGWHTTIFPPYFVAGAIYSGFAMVVTLAIPLRSWYGLKAFITDQHLDNMAKIMLTTGMLVTFGYASEWFMAWYGDNPYEKFMILKERWFGTYWHTYALLMICNCTVVQSFWIPALRRNVYWLFFVSLIVNWGMWLERYVIVVTSLHADFLPSSWDTYHGTIWDYLTYIGTLGFFLFNMFLFVRFLPSISISEMQEFAGHVRGKKAVAAAPLAEVKP
jgi:molybdopterin-containing oxidoreductase family membrane subunit